MQKIRKNKEQGCIHISIYRKSISEFLWVHLHSSHFSSYRVLKLKTESSWEFSSWWTSQVKLELKLLILVDSSQVELPSRVAPLLVACTCETPYCPTSSTAPQKASHQGLSWEQVTFVAFFRHLFHLESQAGFRHLSSRIRQPMCISHHVNSSKNHQPNVSPHKDRHEHEFPFRVSHAWHKITKPKSFAWYLVVDNLLK